jgi:hypothetical protein
MDEMKVDTGGGRQKTVRVNYPSNSLGSKTVEEKKVEKVIEGTVTTRKRGLRGKFSEAFLSEDSSSVGSYVILEVLVPAAKNMLSDAVSQGIERILFGDARPRQPNSRTNHTSYSTRYNDRPPRQPLNRQARANHDFREIIIETRADAEDVLERMRDLINSYNMATVADLYDLVGLTGDYTDDRWGWDDLRSAGVRAIRGGFILILPKTIPVG